MLKINILQRPCTVNNIKYTKTYLHGALAGKGENNSNHFASYFKRLASDKNRCELNLHM